MRHLTAEPVQTDCTKVVYLVRSQLDLMRFICLHIKDDASKGIQREYFVYFVPRRAVVCEKVCSFPTVSLIFCEHGLIGMHAFLLSTLCNCCVL